MDEARYRDLADAAFRRIEAAFDELDPEAVDCERSQPDVITLTFRGGARCVVNTQRPTRQIWVAANARAYHFSYDEASSRWLDDKDRSGELFATLATIVQTGAAASVRF